jgi:hypothetical protein
MSQTLKTNSLPEAARQAGEPVFSINDAVSFQSFWTTFHIGLGDPALLNALMLTLTFAINDGHVDAESLTYKSKAMEYLNKRLCHPREAATEATLHAILLLAGVEVRLHFQFRASHSGNLTTNSLISCQK